MGTNSISPSSSSSSVQWKRHRIKPQLQIQRLYPTSASIHSSHCRLQHDDISSVCCSFRVPRKQSRSLLLLDLVRSGRRYANHGVEGPINDDDDDDGGGNGTMAGAVAMIIGTSIGSGMLALPQRTSPAGFLPTSITMIICWCFLVLEALLLVEVNVNLRNRNIKRDAKPENKRNELDVISIRTMANETLGEWGGALTTVTYIFLGYTSMIAYCSKSGQILESLVYLPASASGFFFTILFTLLILVGGAQTTDHVNQWLTSSMIGLLLAIEVVAVAFGGWAEPGSRGEWGEIPHAIPVMIFSLVYHDIIPVICAYFKGDVTRIRTSVILGSLIPLAALLVWEAIALGLSSSLPDQNIDPIELLMRVRWGGMPFMVGAFSLLAVGTSMIGTLLGFTEFFKEQLNNIISVKIKAANQQNNEVQSGLRRWWGRNRVSCAAMVIVVGPSLFLSTKFPDAFSAATDIAGGYCMTMLFGVLPPAMACAMHDKKDEFADLMPLSNLRPALVGVGVFASGIVVEQIVQDFSILNVLHIN